MQTYGYSDYRKFEQDFEIDRAKKLLEDLKSDKKVDIMVVFAVGEKVANIELRNELLAAMHDRFQSSKFSKQYIKELDVFQKIMHGNSGNATKDLGTNTNAR